MTIITRKTVAVDTNHLLGLQQRFYYERLDKHGIESAQCVGWSELGQEKRFQALTSFIKDKNESYSLLDVGCGVGDLSAYLKDNQYTNIAYTGIDILREMIEGAKRKYPRKIFLRGEFLSYKLLNNYDYVLCSGALNLLNGDNPLRHEKFIMQSIKKCIKPQILAVCSIFWTAVLRSNLRRRAYITTPIKNESGHFVRLRAGK